MGILSSSGVVGKESGTIGILDETVFLILLAEDDLDNQLQDLFFTEEEEMLLNIGKSGNETATQVCQEFHIEKNMSHLVTWTNQVQ